MTTRHVSFSENEFYHLYNRGTDKRDIFIDLKDYYRFQELLYLSNSNLAVDVRSIHQSFESVYDLPKVDSVVAIGAYCLMPNHFHLLVTPLVENGVSKFMNKLGTSYSMYFNKKYERTGSLFEGSFKARHASSDEYLKYLFSYIHLNPVKLIQHDWKEVGIQNYKLAYEYAESYLFGSLIDASRSTRKESVILERTHFPQYFNNPLLEREELLSWLKYQEIT